MSTGPRTDSLVSADSHVVEPVNAYAAGLPPRWRGQAPRLIADRDGGEQFAIPGMSRVLGLGLLGAAGRDPASVRETGTSFRQLRPGAWDPERRLADQDTDGVAAEVIYPSVGLVLLTHINRAYAAACLRAYNRWLAGFCAAAPERLAGCGVTAAASSDEARADLIEIHRLGLRGALFPLEPGTATYDSPGFDPVWATAVELDLPISFHAQPPRRPSRGPGDPANVMAPIWEAQHVLLDLVLGGVLVRNPRLRIVFAEFDAGWVPHCVDRMDHQVTRHGHWLGLGRDLDRLPSEYVRESVAFTTQGGPGEELAAGVASIMWAGDFPHSESTFPHSRRAAADLVAHLAPEQQADVTGRTARALYGLAEPRRSHGQPDQPATTG